MRVAIDSGGTFTDCVFVRDGALQIIKVASRPNAPAEAIAEAVSLADQNAEKSEPLDLVCGTTVGTNALLERRGARVALVTTAGFEDVLEIGRQARPKLYDLFFEKPEPLVPSSRRFGVTERVTADGSVLTGLKPSETARVLRNVRRSSAQSVALCFLFSFRNTRHEKEVAAALRAAGYLVSVSHEILPEFREYERTSTVVINAYLMPVMSSYLRDIALRLRAPIGRKPTKVLAHYRGPRVRIMQSNGGIISAEQAASEPVRTILSGPAGGVIGASSAAKLAGIEKCISFDMGGTSTDVALLSGETLQSTNEGSVAGLPVAVPMLEIHTVGAGGGSLARFDAGGALRVGPESAGAKPGPICYGGGTRPTVTDAHAVLGHLGDSGLLGGAFVLDIPRARTLMEKEIGTGRRAFRTVEAFATGIVAVANAVMEKAIRVISVERGHDSRDYSLVAFGGAGGLHACELADALEMRGVLVPVFPGGLSALGILGAGVVKEFSRTVLLSSDEVLNTPKKLEALFGPLEREAVAVLSREGFARHKMRLVRTVDMRYTGQAYDLNVPAGNEMLNAFHVAHEQRYGYHDKKRKVEIVTVRCRAVGLTEKPPLVRARRRSTSELSLRGRQVDLVFSGAKKKGQLYRREDLCAEDVLNGPAVVTEYSATTLIPPGWLARVDQYGLMLLSRR